MKDYWIRKTLIAGIILLQVLIILNRGQQKSNYYIDELYSMGYAHSFTYDSKERVYINESEDWKWEEWIPNQILKNRLVVCSKDSLARKNPLSALYMLLTRRIYHGLLNLVMYAFSPGKVTKMPGIILNIPFFILTQLLLYRICMESTAHTLSRDVEAETCGDKRTGNLAIPILALVMYGFSAAGVGTAVYIRFYSLTTLLFVSVIRLHQVIWVTKSCKICIRNAFISLLLLYLAMKNSELIFILGGALITVFFAGLLFKQQAKKAVYYCLTTVPAGLYYVCRKTFLMDMLLHPERYTDLSGAQGLLAGNLLYATSEDRLQITYRQNQWIVNLLFGNSFVVSVFLLLIAVCFAVILYDRFICGNKTSGKRLCRELSQYVLYSEMGETDGGSNGGLIHDSHDGNNNAGFIWIIIAVELIYLIFSRLTCLSAERYFFFLFPMITLTLWMTIDYLNEKVAFSRMLLITCGFLTLTGIIFGWVAPERIPYLYVEDRPLIQALAEGNYQDVILVSHGKNPSRHHLYECINLMGDTARIYPVSEERHAIDTETCSDCMLIWVEKDIDYSMIAEDMLSSGYDCRKLGNTHISDVYVAEKKNITKIKTQGTK